MDRDVWAPIVNRFNKDLRNFDYMGRSLDVRENVKFKGGFFPLWLHSTYPKRVCVISIEFKKFFMDEWTGQPDHDHISAIGRALQQAADGVTQELETFEQTAAKQ